MLSFAIRRIFLSLPVLLGVSILVFAAGFLAQGDPVQMMLGDKAANPAVVQQIRHEYGLDKPPVTQYFNFLRGLLRGDLGYSYYQIGRPVSSMVANGIPVTTELSILAMLAAVVVGIPLGVAAAVHHNSGLDSFSMFFAVIGVSIPRFVMAAVLVLAFSIKLKWLPVAGMATPASYVLPTLVLAFEPAANIARLTRASLLDVLGQDYIRTARAKGLADRIVVYKHALRNALIPVITMLGLSFGFLLGGSFIIESFFNMLGIGWLGLQAIFQRDFPVIRAVVLLYTFVFIMVNLAVDLAYGAVNPRIRYR